MKRILLLVSSVIIVYSGKAQNSAQWDTLGQGMGGKNSCVKALTVNDTDQSAIYAGGSFKTTEGKTSNNIAQWYSSGCCGGFGKWSTLGTGVNKEVTALAMYNHRLIAGGAFDTAGGVYSKYIASWDSVKWDSLQNGLNGQVYALAAFDSVLYVGGNFTLANGSTVNRVVQWNGTSWSSLGSGFDSNTVYCLSIYQDTLYAGGSFTKTAGNPVNYIAKWDGTKWIQVGNGMNNTVYALTVYNDSLYAGGAFTKAGGKNANYIAEWNGKDWDSLGSGTNDTVRALTPAGYTIAVTIKPKNVTGNTYSVALVVGGNFTKAGGIPNSYVTLYFPGFFSSNGFHSGWNTIPRINKPVFALTSNQTSNYLGGEFDSIFNSMWAGGDTLMANYIGQFSFLLGGGINEISDNGNVKVFPNPSNGKFTFELKDNNEKLKVEVYNMLGEKVYSQYSNPNTQYQIDLSNSPTGIYLYRITTEKGEFVGSGKLVIE